MQGFAGKMKKLQSMRNDLAMRVSEVELKTMNKQTVNSNILQEKLNKLIVNVEVTDSEMGEKNLSQSEKERVNQEIEGLRKDLEKIQEKIYSFRTKSSGKVSNENSEDLILRNLQFLKEISEQMLGELQNQNNTLEGKIKEVDFYQREFKRSNEKMNRTERWVDNLSNTCLISTMVTLLLIILLVSAVL
jgi:hypothetical protein